MSVSDDPRAPASPWNVLRGDFFGGVAAGRPQASVCHGLPVSGQKRGDGALAPFGKGCAQLALLVRRHFESSLQRGSHRVVD